MTRELPTSLLLFMAHRAAEDEIFAAVAAAGHGGITRAQGRLLAGIDEGGTRVGLLAERARVAKQTAVSLVDHLVAAGYVQRVPDPSDGRARLVRLTAEGESVLPATRAGEESVESSWRDLLGDRRLGELRTSLEAILAESPPS